MTETIYLLIAFLSGFAYRLSEIDHIWVSGGKYQKINGDYVYYRPRSWPSAWMRGTVYYEGVQWLLFHKLTFKIFYDGYHFFNFIYWFLPFAFIVSLVWVPWDSIWLAVCFWPMRYLGTWLGKVAVIKRYKPGILADNWDG